MKPFCYPGQKTISLSAREKEVMNLLSTGLFNKEIACTLGIRTQSVCNILNIAYKKLNVKNRVEAINKYFSNSSPQMSPSRHLALSPSPPPPL
jgi:Response regulator containing a CheY-like receiver domain and an HTH DNA-binding domain